MLPPRFQTFMKIFLSPKEKLKKKTIKDDEDITKDKRDNNEGKVYPLLHIFYWKYLIDRYVVFTKGMQ